MSWLTNFVRPKIKAFIKPKDVPENLWTRCTHCGQMLFNRELKENIFVCRHCEHHMRIDAKSRLEATFDDGHYDSIATPDVKKDPVNFKDTKRYSERLKSYQQLTGQKDAILVGKGLIGGKKAVVAAFDFGFMGGSMGVAVGEAIVKAAETALQSRSALVIVPASGGARMQEGILSMMQMPRTVIAISRLKEAGLPYITVLSDPTTGGVSASFAMLGDVAIAEPKAMIGFAGPRVIQETIREKLPEGFQTAEYLLEHGMVDMVTHRKDINAMLGKIIGHLLN